MTTPSPQGPLAGVRILEISHMLAGPYCGMILADLGAEVVKIETGEGDVARRVGDKALGGHNLYFASLNRNKKSVLVDLSRPEGQAHFHDLARRSQGLITNLRPRAIRKLGLTYDALKNCNPEIACLALTGFGLDGPLSDLPAYDYIVQAMTGLMMLTGEPGSPPVRAGYSVVDNTGGMMGAIGLVAKLFERRGGQVDVALFDTMLSQLNYLGSALLNAGEAPQRYAAGGHPFFVPAQTFEASDGYIAIFITHDEFWKAFAQELGRPDWLINERFSTMKGRSENREPLLREIASELKKQSARSWVSRLRPLGVVIAEVGDLEDALKLEQTFARGMIATVQTDEGRLRLIGNPIRGDGVASAYRPPPVLGEHSLEYRRLCEDDARA